MFSNVVGGLILWIGIALFLSVLLKVIAAVISSIKSFLERSKDKVTRDG